MPRWLHALLLAALLTGALLADTGGVARAAAPAPVALDGARWERLADPGDRGVAAGLPDGTAGTGWARVAVPDVVDPRPDEGAFDGSIAWYRTTFRAPASADAVAWALRFEQVRRTARVWLNGREVGAHRDPYVPFELPATGLRPGANVLVVRVDYRRTPGTREGWWNWGGITRPVSLVPRGPVALEQPAVLSEVACTGPGRGCRASVLVDGTLTNTGAREATDATVRLALRPPAGADDRATVRATHRVRPLAPGETARVRFRVRVPEPALWWPTDPALYAARLTTTLDGTEVGRDDQAVGLRGVRVVDGMLELNGRQLDLRGASVQEDTAGQGPVVTPADADRTVAELERIGANVTRAHYLLSDELLDRFDRAGIMVWQQSPVYHADVFLRTRAHREEALETVRGTVAVARRHASVITHSVANELDPEPDRLPGTAAFLDGARDVVHDVDPTLPASVDLLSYPNYPRAAAYARYPLLGINSYFGWYEGKPGLHATSERSAFGPYLDRMRALYPTQGLVVTEFGAEASEPGPANEKQTYAFQTRYLDDALAAVRARPFVGGAIYWTLREFAVKPDWDGGADPPGPRDGIHKKGLIAYDGRVKPAFAAARREFRATPPFRVVTRAQAANAPAGLPGGPMALLVALALLVLSLLLLDVWALRGLWRARGGGRPRDARRPQTLTVRQSPSAMT